MMMALLYRAGFEELLLVLSECGFRCCNNKDQYKQQLGSKGFIFSSQFIDARLKAGTVAETMGSATSYCSSWLAQPTFLYMPGHATKGDINQ